MMLRARLNVKAKDKLHLLVAMDKAITEILDDPNVDVDLSSFTNQIGFDKGEEAYAYELEVGPLEES